MKPTRACALATVVGAVATSPLPATASLTIDLRAVSTTGGSVINPKMVFFTGAPGNTVTMQAIAVVIGNNGNPNDEGMLSCSGSLLSASGGLLGNLVATRSSNMTNAGGSNGLVTDLDGDSDLDVGSNNNASSANFFSPRGFGPAPVFGTETLIGTVTWTFIGGGYDTSVNFRQRFSSTAGSWFEDGTQITSPNFSGGVPVIITLPEPSMLSIAIGSGLTLLARRRR